MFYVKILNTEFGSFSTKYLYDFLFTQIPLFQLSFMRKGEGRCQDVTNECFLCSHSFLL